MQPWGQQADQWVLSLGSTLGLENIDISVQPKLRKAVRRGRASRQYKTRVVKSPRTRKVPTYALLDQHALATIEDQADWILHTIGVEFRGDATALALFAEAGATAVGDRVTFDPGLARQLCATAPAEFTLHARSGQYRYTWWQQCCADARLRFPICQRSCARSQIRNADRLRELRKTSLFQSLVASFRRHNL